MDQALAKRAWQVLRQAEKWLIIAHHNPDGDALASTNIFLEIAAQLDKPALAYCANQPSDNFGFLSKTSQLTDQLDYKQFSPACK
ncbi:MAG TPA: hypothetical protein PLX67_01140 [bacterium]|nr:hypothetical protein [bacterium]